MSIDNIPSCKFFERNPKFKTNTYTEVVDRSIGFHLGKWDRETIVENSALNTISESHLFFFIKVTLAGR
jgi:hypothetical protein